MFTDQAYDSKIKVQGYKQNFLWLLPTATARKMFSAKSLMFVKKVESQRKSKKKKIFIVPSFNELRTQTEIPLLTFEPIVELQAFDSSNSE